MTPAHFAGQRGHLDCLMVHKITCTCMRATYIDNVQYMHATYIIYSYLYMHVLLSYFAVFSTILQDTNELFGVHFVDI